MGVKEEASILEANDNDHFDDVPKETAEVDKAVEKEVRDFSKPPTDDFEAVKGKAKEEPAEPKEEAKGEAPPEPEEDPYKRWKGKKPEDIAKAHYEAEKWGKQKANEASELRKRIEELEAVKREPPKSTPTEEGIDEMRKKYGDEAVDMILKVAGVATKPLTEEMAREKEGREVFRQKDFAAYHESYKTQNKDYAENMGTIQTITKNIVTVMSDMMRSAGCSEDQIGNTIHQLNYHKAMPYLAHTILKGENVESYAKRLAKEGLQKEIEVNNSKAEFGGGNAIPSAPSSVPEFKNIDEEIEWKLKNDPDIRSLKI